MVDSIIIQKHIPEEKYNEVIEHLRSNFFADEPLNKAVKLCDHGEKHHDLEMHSLKTLEDNLSVMAIDSNTNRIIGVALNGIQNPNDIKAAKEELLRAKDEKYKNIFSFLYDINRDLNLFAKYRVDQIFECRILSVDQNYRGQGLAQRLLEKSLEVAEEAGIKLFKQDATSFYTQKIAENMGFVSVFELRYKAYRNDDGKIIFETSEPHKFLKVMVKLLK
ncbi:hypothetical protein V9T40_008252 [Parthenolecanium corni]|uniref:aralkylamine N-acetyltransferase n=1 Tax=Parthenolecanium corni TaxID=536013 RepID=A0AAN9TQ19_9HEMI